MFLELWYQSERNHQEVLRFFRQLFSIRWSHLNSSDILWQISEFIQKEKGPPCSNRGISTSDEKRPWEIDSKCDTELVI